MYFSPPLLIFILYTSYTLSYDTKKSSHSKKKKKYKKAVDSHVFLSLTCSSELTDPLGERLVYELAPGLGSDTPSLKRC
jgi:hypothetical protein